MRPAALLLLAGFALADGLASDLPFERSQALVALGREGERACDRIPRLIEALYDEDTGVRVQAVQAAGALGSVAWRAHPLLHELAAEDDWLRGAARQFVVGPVLPPDRDWWRLGRAIRSGATPCEPHLGHPHAYVRHHAYEALLGRDPFPVATVQARLDGAPPRERRLAAWTLARAAHRSGPAADLLEALLDDRDSRICDSAARGLRKPRPVALIAALGRWLSAPETERQDVARLHLGGWGGAAAPLLPHLIDHLYEPVPAPAVLDALRDLGPAAAPAAPYLREVAESRATHEAIRPALRALAASLGGAGGAPPAAEGPNRRRALAIARLESMGGAGALGLAANLEREDRKLRHESACALMRLGGEAAPARESLMRTTLDPRLALQVLHGARLLSGADLPWLLARVDDPAVATAAIEAIGGLGEAARPAVPALIGKLGPEEVGGYARAALLALGPVAVEAIAEVVRSGSPELRARAERFLQDAKPAPPATVAEAAPRRRAPRVPAAVPRPAKSAEELAAQLGDPDAVVRAEAVKALGGLGAGARPALAAIGAAYARDPALRTPLQAILESFGSDALPWLFAGTAGRDRQATVRAALAIVACGDAGVAFLAERLGDRDPRVRLRALKALGYAKERAIDLVGPSVGGDPHPRLRQAALELLMSQRAEPGRVIPHLVRALDSPDAWGSVSKALASFGEEGARAVRAAATGGEGSPGAALLLAESGITPDTLALLLRSREPAHVSRALAAVPRFGPAAASALPSLRRLLDGDVDGRTLRPLLLAFASMGPAAREVAPRLQELYGSLPPESAPLLRATLALLEHGAHAVPGLIEEGTGEVRTFVLEMLRAQGAAALDAHALLVRIPKPVFEHEVLEMLVKIGKPAVPVFRGLLADAAPALRKRGALGLAGLGGEAAEAVPDLVRALDDRDEDLVAEVATALGAIGPAAREAIPRLRVLARFPRYAKVAGAALKAIERGS